MIPRRLKLRNFLSYRQCDLDFRGLHVAVLSGRNGDGKSSLLDGMTWALWGEARGRLEDDRIYLGEDEMLVDFEFEVDGDVFQVIRKRTRGKGAGALDFFQVDQDGYRMPRSGGTMRETQAEIIARLRMDYATFVNSAFIAQGRADEFTRRSAADRKEIFRKILGLEFYEALSVRANERRREAETLAGERERLLGDSAQQLEALPEIEASMAALTAELEDLEPRLCALNTQAGELKLAAAERERLRQALWEAEQRRDTLTQDVHGLEEEIAEADRQCEVLRETLAGAGEIEEQFAMLREMRAAEHEVAERAAAARGIEERLEVAERAIEQERTRLEMRRDDLQKQVSAAEESAAALPSLREQERETTRERDELARIDERLEEMRRTEGQQRETAERERTQAQAALDRAREYKDNQERLQGESRCPVCRQELSPQDASRIMEEYGAERRALGEQYRECLAAAAEAEQAAKAAAEGVTSLVAERDERDRLLRQREAELHRRLTEALAAAEALPGLQQALDETRTLLDEETYAEDARAARDNCRRELLKVGYDAAEHQQLRRRIAELGPIEEQYNQATTGRERLRGLEASLARDRARLERERRELGESEAAVRAAADALEASADVSGELERVEGALAEARELELTLTRRYGSAESTLSSLRQMEARVEETRDEVNALREEMQLFAELREAFGKNGVQALLIDQALPELERIANEMLERMTGGRIQLRLETQRETKKRTTVETLDIRISDELGTRDYEMYSGGEAFRVDFALRIALSQLLAGRAGAALPTLIIDEGFGTQDQEGIDRLVDAINAIREDFRLILVVTHLEELKERFERRIEVAKDPQRGSAAWVV